MNRNESRALREERASIANQMSELATGGLKTAEDRTKFDELDVAQKELKDRIDRIEAATGLSAELRGTGAPPSGQPTGGADDQDIAKTNEGRYRAAWKRCMQHGFEPKPHLRIRGISADDKSLLLQRMVSLDIPQEYRDMLTQGGGAYPGGTGSAGGFFVPTGFVDEVEQALKYYGPMLNGDMGDPKIMDTASGQPLPYPTSNDTAVVGERLAENAPVTTNDVTLGMILLGAWIYSTRMVKVSTALLQDSAFDVEAFLREQFAIRLGRILNTDFTIGAGSGSQAPNGIITAATSAGTAVGANSNDGTSAANTLGSDDMTTLEHSVDPLYRRGAKYMFHDGTLAALKKVKDKYGRPLWLPSVQVNAPDTINGYSYLINNDMDQLQTTSGPVTRKVALFGALSKYLIRRVKELSILRLDERFAEYGQVAFLGFARYDANLIDAGTHPVKYIQTTY